MNTHRDGGGFRTESNFNSRDLFDRVERAVFSCPVVDFHTHLFPASFGDWCLSGPDEMLTYHYLIAETLRVTRQEPESFFALGKPLQADLVWKTLFVDRTPLSEAASGVASTFETLGLDATAPDLAQAREYARQPIAERLNAVFRISNVESVTMTNDPFDPAERACYDGSGWRDDRFRTALRIDRLLFDDACGLAELAAQIGEWTRKIDACYVAASLPPDWCGNDSAVEMRLKQSVIPAIRDLQLPLALMIGVRRAVNPRLGSAGDGSGTANLAGLERLASLFPDVSMYITTLSRENAHELAVIARKFSNVIPFGCWWFMNNPSLVRETTTMRLEMLGSSFIPQHSDARVTEQLVYKWRHARRSLAECLCDRYAQLAKDGLVLQDAHIEADVNTLLRINATVGSK